MWKRSLFVFLAIFALSVIGAKTSHAADQVKLTVNHIAGEWVNINNLILALAGAIAMDDEWPQKLRDMKPKASLSSDAPAIVQAIGKFASKLNVLLDSEDLKKMMVFPASANISVPVLYTHSGQVLDGLVEYLIKSDSLATVGVYYKEQDLTGKNNADIAAEIDVASQRLDSFITESGL